jgi:hypothetical protein
MYTDLNDDEPSVEPRIILAQVVVVLLSSSAR